MITKKQSIKKSQKEHKRQIEQTVKDLTNKINVENPLNKISEEVAPELNLFITHEPYKAFFQDLAYAVSKDVTLLEEKTTVDDLIPHLFTVVGENIGFVAHELNILFLLFQNSKKTLINLAAKDEVKEAADRLLMESDIEKLHQHIKETIELISTRKNEGTSEGAVEGAAE